MSLPPAEGFVAALASRVLLADGATGTLAQASGVRAEGPGAELCLIAPELVMSLHRRYLDAGADVVTTHTYGATRTRLARFGLAGRTAEINRAGAALAVAARDERAAEGRPAWVAGSVSPASTPTSVRAGPPPGRSGVRERDDAVREQVAALVEGGVDLVVLETFTAGDELARAVAAAREVTDVPLVAQATFLADDPYPRTAAGEEPAAVLDALAGVGDLAAVGTNCTLGPQGLLAVLRAMAGHTVLPLTAQPNAGLPHVVGDRSVRFVADADHFARYVRRYVAAGARLVGGCCGTTPEHTAAARAALDGLAEATGADGAAEVTAGHVAAVPVRDGAHESGDRSPGAHTAGPGPGAGPGALRRWVEAAPGERGFLVAADVAVGGAVATNVARARASAPAVDAVFLGRSRTRRAPSTSPALAIAVAERVDVDVAVTVTGGDTGRIALQADLLGLHALGVRIVVCETGSPPVHADQPVRDGGWDVDAVALLRLADGLNRGVDADGLDLAGATALMLGARCSPGAADLEGEARRLRAEIDAGARFVVSHPVYELERARVLLEAVREHAGDGVPVLLTVAPPRDFAHAEYLAHEVPDVEVPDTVLDRMHRGGSAAGPLLGAELARGVAGLADGLVVRWTAPDPAPAVARMGAAAREGGR